MKTNQLRFNNQIEVEILLDSINPQNKRITTWRLTLPNIIHAELLRHRMFSFSVSSFRAIPTNKLTDKQYFLPVDVGYNCKGMSAEEHLSGYDLFKFQEWWRSAYDCTKYIMEQMKSVNPHKQHINRLLMPFDNIVAVVTTTEPGLENFFNLRIAEYAQPEIHDLAYKMRHLYENSTSQYLRYGEWHIPFVSDKERKELPLWKQLFISAARCARTSYTLNTTGKTSTWEADIGLAKRLIANVHASPFEHQTMSFNPEWAYYKFDGVRPEYIYEVYSDIYRNTYGFMQLRKIIEEVDFSDGNYGKVLEYKV